jgi:nicotinate-nucleotide--dimethylbenzimidazole phosphoribosyltransferase
VTFRATSEPLDEAAMAAVRAHLDRLTKPPGSLGRLERLVEQLAGITGSSTPRIDRPAVVVFAGDHGVTARGVSAYPSDVTAQMVANFVHGGAAVNVLAEAAGAELVVVDVGVSGDGPPINLAVPGAARLVRARVAAGTRDMTAGPAMRRDEALAAIEVGRRIVEELIAGGIDTIAVGEMGIGNTTAASAVVAALTGRPPAEVTGRGTGLDAEAVGHKVDVIEAALRRHQPRGDDPIGALAAVGGFEIAALVGAILAAAGARTPVVLDGFITGSAALVAASIAPGLGPRLIASHRSPEPGHAVVIAELGFDPLLDLELRLGEGSGAALALPLIRAATQLLAGMATFDSAGVSGPVASEERRSRPCRRS